MVNYRKNHRKELKNNIILKEVNIRGNLCGEFAEYTIDHVYENKGTNDVEAIYTFPIPERAVISGFEAVLGGRTIKGLIQDKEEAKRYTKISVKRIITLFYLKNLVIIYLE